MRHEDPLSDYGRQKRQRQVLQKMVIKVVSLSASKCYQAILNSLNGNLKTGLTFDDMIQIRAKHGDTSHHIKSETLQVRDATIDGLAYQVPTIKELKKVSNHIRKTLGLAKVSKLTTDADINGTESTYGSDNNVSTY